MVMVVLMGAILVAGLRTTFRWQNAFWIIASAGTFLAFIVLVFGSHTDFVNNFNSVSAKYGSPHAVDPDRRRRGHARVRRRTRAT